MKLPAALLSAATRFDQLTLRERALVSVATLAVLIALWDSAFMAPLTVKRQALSAELSSLSDSMTATGMAMETATAFDPTQVALKKLKETHSALAAANAELDSTAAGLIAPERMTAVIDDVLRRQHALTLISLHNKAVTSLVPINTVPKILPAADPTASNSAEPQPAPAVSTGPYVHPVELVVEGNYLDIVAYLQALEALPWHFYWQRLELETTDYPTNRARIELSTLSLEQSWLGVGEQQHHE